ncbi:hypothetical protein OWC48_34440 [Bradyrhizobium sp. Arg816]|nr:hypothetical protein [Bradyrhizobium sp. Arg816]
MAFEPMLTSLSAQLTQSICTKQLTQSICTKWSARCTSAREGTEHGQAHDHESLIFTRVYQADQADFATAGPVLIPKRPKSLILFGGRTRARTWDPLIKSQPRAENNQ